MRNLVMFNLMTLDGHFEGPDRDIGWHSVDGEFNEHVLSELFPCTDLLLFGRVTYELMAGFWPTPEAVKNDPIVAGKMNSLQKIVFSRTLNRAAWNNTRLVKENLEEEVRKLKEQPGKGIVLLGSGTIVPQLAQAGLIDEYRIMLNPVVLGAGTPLFKGLGRRLDLQLLSARTFRNGNVLLRYRPAGKEKEHGKDIEHRSPIQNVRGAGTGDHPCL
jgi:dihydrofolate reductase